MADLLWVYDEPPETVVQRWEWPMAVYRGPFMKHAAYIICEDNYSPIREKNGNHKEISVVIRRYDGRSKDGSRMLCSHKFKKFEEAVRFTQQYLDRHPEWCPKII
jgi:hypothetical protein